MAIYHLEAKVVSRGAGRSAVAASAYLSSSRLYNDYDGIQHDYTKKQGLVWQEVFLPEYAPQEWKDREQLWNAVEEVETAKDSRLAREFVVALPIELSREQQIELLQDFIREQFVADGMCADAAIHDTDGRNPHAHILLTVRPLDEQGHWQYKTEKEYLCMKNGEERGFTAAEFRTAKNDGWEKQYPYKVGKKKVYMTPSDAEVQGLVRADKHPKSTRYGRQNPISERWNSEEQLVEWRKAWADVTNLYLERAGRAERIDHRSNAERGIDEIPTVHMGVAACQMEKKGIATEKGELNRNIQKANRLIREIRAQIGKLKEWTADLFKARETAPEQPPQSPNLANLLMKYLSVQREKSRKYSQRWQQQHTADELKTIAAAVNYLSEHGISNLDELDASLSSVSDKAYSIREGMKTAEQRMKELQKLMEYGRNYQTYKPIQDEYRQIRWKGKQEKFAEARRAELTLWDAANRYLHAHLPEGVKTLPISAWEKEYTALKAQREAEYETLKDTRAEVAELQKIRKCVDIALRADQPAQTQSRTKRQEQER